MFGKFKNSEPSFDEPTPLVVKRDTKEVLDEIEQLNENSRNFVKEIATKSSKIKTLNLSERISFPDLPMRSMRRSVESPE